MALTARRQDRKKLFFPVYVDPSVPKITGFGAPLPIEEVPDLSPKYDREVAWPIRTDGSLGNWRVSPSTLKLFLEKGYVKLGGYDASRKTWTVLYLGKKAQKQIQTGAIIASDKDPTTDVVTLKFAKGEQRQVKTVWHRTSHDSETYGSTILRQILNEGGSFAFPKSLYAVRDTLKVVTADKPEALILDFFAGSGTTFHATALLNSELPGKRRCILVTNNEVTEKREKALEAAGHFPGDPDFERHGVAESVTWPRCKWSVLGKRDDGSELQGEYLDGRHLQEGFDENIEYFRLDFLDPSSVARGDSFKAVLPILWLIAGCEGRREESKGSQAWFIPKRSPFAVLVNEKEFRRFKAVVRASSHITWIFLITDSESNFASMRSSLGKRFQCMQLYRSYLENFRLNTSLVEQG